MSIHGTRNLYTIDYFSSVEKRFLCPASLTYDIYLHSMCTMFCCAFIVLDNEIFIMVPDAILVKALAQHCFKCSAFRNTVGGVHLFPSFPTGRAASDEESLFTTSSVVGFLGQQFFLQAPTLPPATHLLQYTIMDRRYASITNQTSIISSNDGGSFKWVHSASDCCFPERIHLYTRKFKQYLKRHPDHLLWTKLLDGLHRDAGIVHTSIRKCIISDKWSSSVVHLEVVRDYLTTECALMGKASPFSVPSFSYSMGHL